MKEEDLFKKTNSVSELMLGMAAYTSSSILGPLVVFGALGYLIDKWTGKDPIFLLLGILVAFISTNVLIYKKVKRLNKKFEEYYNKEEGFSSAKATADEKEKKSK